MSSGALTEGFEESFWSFASTSLAFWHHSLATVPEWTPSSEWWFRLDASSAQGFFRSHQVLTPPGSSRFSHSYHSHAVRC